MQEVSSVPPQSVGRLTPFYKLLAANFKTFPVKNLFLISLVLIFFTYLLLGALLIKLASILQIGY